MERSTDDRDPMDWPQPSEGSHRRSPPSRTPLVMIAVLASLALLLLGGLIVGMFFVVVLLVGRAAHQAPLPPEPPALPLALDLDALPPGNTRPALRLQGKDCIRLADTVGMLDLNQDFTIEMWVRLPENPPYMLYLAGDEVWPGMNAKVEATRPSGWVLRTRPGQGQGIALDFTVAAETPGEMQSEWIGARGQPEPARPGWQHIAVCHSDAQVRLFWNGRLHAELACADRRFVSSPTPCYVGPREYAFTDRTCDAEIGAFQITKRARYRADFEPPDHFDANPQTLLLLDFSVAAGINLPDLSGQRHAGTVLPDPQRGGMAHWVQRAWP